jgi:hypothetical protein
VDAYQKLRGANECIHGLVEFRSFHFVFNEDLQFIKGKNANNIFKESGKTDTHTCYICWFQRRQVMDFTNVTDDWIKFMDSGININTIFIDVVQTLEKNNSDIS